jgi:hypothetical protein
MKKMIVILMLAFISSVEANDGLFWAAKTNATQVLGLYRSTVSTPGAVQCVGTPAQYLKMTDGAVVKMTDAEKAFVDLPAKYKKTVEGVLVEMTAEEKHMVDVPAMYKNPDGTEMTDEQKAAVDAAEEVARQAAKSAALKNAENNFLSLCDVLTAATNHAKLSFAELNAIIAAMPLEQQLVIGVKLLAVDAEAKREGGLLWWDDCTWHPVIISPALGAAEKGLKQELRKSVKK